MIVNVLGGRHATLFWSSDIFHLRRKYKYCMYKKKAIDLFKQINNDKQK